MKDTQTTIQEIKDRVKAFRAERGWMKQDFKDYPIGLVLEATEVMELFQWLSGKEVAGNEKLKQAIGDELADVLYWVVTMADELAIDLAEVFERKEKKRAEKYPVEMFNPSRGLDERKSAYYQVKARTRGGHPLADNIGENDH